MQLYRLHHYSKPFSFWSLLWLVWSTVLCSWREKSPKVSGIKCTKVYYSLYIDQYSKHLQVPRMQREGQTDQRCKYWVHEYTCIIHIDTNSRRNSTYHFGGTEVFWVHLHMYHPCLLATANLLLILSLPPGKKEILAGTKSFPHLLQDSSAVITSCVVCFVIVSSRQNMSPAFFSPLKRTHPSPHVSISQHIRGEVNDRLNVGGIFPRQET